VHNRSSVGVHYAAYLAQVREEYLVVRYVLENQERHYEVEARIWERKLGARSLTQLHIGGQPARTRHLEHFRRDVDSVDSFERRGQGTQVAPWAAAKVRRATAPNVATYEIEYRSHVACSRGVKAGWVRSDTCGLKRSLAREAAPMLAKLAELPRIDRHGWSVWCEMETAAP